MNRKWTNQEIELVKLNYEAMTYADLGIILERTENAVRGLCHRLGLRKRESDWTIDEIDRLMAYYESHGSDGVDLAKLEEMFPGRIKSNICRKARQLGLTDPHRSKTREHSLKMALISREWHKNNEHPRGMAGKKHSHETKQLISQKSREMWADSECILNSDEYRQRVSDRMSLLHAGGKVRNRYSKGAMGKREDLGGLFVRSSWEANYARYLNWLIGVGEIERWEYESITFWFEEIKRGTRSYTPDFTVHLHDGSVEYHEVKGWMDQKSKTKLKRMAKYYPNVKIILVDKDVYYAIKRDVQGFIPNWE